MKHSIYLLEPTEETWDKMPTYDIFEGFVVIADSEKEARNMCESADEGDIWINQKQTKCTKIGESNRRKGMVLCSYC